MASNQQRWVFSLYGHKEPLILPGNFAAGTSVPIKRGELLELTGNTNTEWVPMDSDYGMAANVAIAACEIKDGDPAGYYPIIVPRDGDVFEFALDASDDLAQGTPLYWVSSESVTDTAGSNIIGHVVAGEQYASIYPQVHTSDTAEVSKGTTLGFQTRVLMTIERSNTYFAAIQKA
jgi:hypothetical protein